MKDYVTPSFATCAQFFRVGLEAGVCSPDSARAWALSVIEKLDAPPGEIIEVSWSKPLPQLIDDLNSVQGEADLELAGRWLLHILLGSMPEEKQLWHALKAAKQIALSTGIPLEDNELYFLVDSVEDELNLAELGIYGSVAECRTDLEGIISRYSSPPPTAILT